MHLRGRHNHQNHRLFEMTTRADDKCPLRAGRSLRDLCTPSVCASGGRDEILLPRFTGL
jgi:hypothetical protein